MRRAAASLLLCAALALPGEADESLLVLDPERSEIDFLLGATLHTVRGSFRLESGEIRFDPDTGKISGQVLVDARSGETGIGARDERMHEDVLESQRFPAIAFRPQRLETTAEGDGALALRVSGRLTLLGDEHELSVELRARRQGEAEVAVEGRFEVPYVAWGLRDPGNFLLRVDDRVEVHLKAQGTLGPAAPAR